MKSKSKGDTDSATIYNFAVTVFFNMIEIKIKTKHTLYLYYNAQIYIQPAVHFIVNAETSFLVLLMAEPLSDRFGFLF